MILLLEGCSAVGKTSLANRFSKELDIPIQHFGIPPVDGVFDYFYRELDIGITMNRHLILDRFHLSNHAYNGKLGGGVLSLPEWLRLDEILSRFETWLILMVDDPFLIHSRLQEGAARPDGAQSLSRDEVGNIQNRFSDALRMSAIEVKGSYQYRQFVDMEGTDTPQMEWFLGKMRELMSI